MPSAGSIRGLEVIDEGCVCMNLLTLLRLQMDAFPTTPLPLLLRLVL